MQRLTRRTLLTAAIGGFSGIALWRGRSAAVAPTGAASSPSAPTATNGLATFVRTSRALGTQVSLTLAGCDEAPANHAAAEAFTELERVEQALSVYRADSDLGRLNAAQAIDHADVRLLEVLSAALAMSAQTGGAFDPTVQPLWSLHAKAAKEGRIPTELELAEVRRAVDWRAVRTEGSRVSFDRPGMALTFNGIAQGYATDRVKHVLERNGVRHALIDIGELTSLGRKSTEQSWQVGIQHPRHDDAYVAVARLDGRSLATSGDYATPTGSHATGEENGAVSHRNHHIFDPATGRSPTELASVTIAAPTAMQADALSTAVFVLGPDRGLRLIQSTPGADALFVLKNQSILRTDKFPIVDTVG